MSLAQLGTMLNVVIVLTFLYLAISLACSTILEWIAARFERRARMLRERIDELLGSEAAATFFTSPLIRGLSGRSGAPSYIAATEFATAALAPALSGAVVDKARLPESLRPLHEEVGGDPEKLRARVALWYEAAMERLTGTYHRWSQLWLFVIGLAAAALFNLDSVNLAASLWGAREQLEPLVARIETWREETGRTAPTTDAEWIALANDEAFRELVRDAAPELTIPIGYEGEDLAAKATAALQGWTLLRLIGWLLTAMAAMLGAKFWFDVLGGALKLRAAGVKPPPPSS